MAEPKWKLKVEQLMACNCNWGCPCSFDAPPTYGKCETALAYRIAKGSYGGGALDGFEIILLAAGAEGIPPGDGPGGPFLYGPTAGPQPEGLGADGPAQGRGAK